MSKKWIVPLVLALSLVACSSEPATLEALIDPGGETVGFGSFTTGYDKTFGFFVCSNNGQVELQEVTPIQSEGEIEFLGARVYTSPDMFVGAADGFPADGLDESRLETLTSAIDSDCDEPDGEERVQVLVGAERTGLGGGVLDGFVLSWDDGSVEVPFTILLCGDEMEFCEALIPEDGGTATTTPTDS